MSDRQLKALKEAEQLRLEAAEMEEKLGIKKELIPIEDTVLKNPSDNYKEGDLEVNKTKIALIRSRLGYLSVGDALVFTKELDMLKKENVINLWNSELISSNTNFAVKSLQRTKIEPVDLGLDSVGYDYQKVFLNTLLLASILGVLASAMPPEYGSVGFLIGYGAALFPILVVGIGSIAPELIGDIIKKVRYVTDDEAKERRISQSAAKFLVGYILGLPLSNFKNGLTCAEADFFHRRPNCKNHENSNQLAIAEISATCLAGAVGECISFGNAQETNPSDVNLIYELMSVTKLKDDGLQDHIRWSVLKSFEILTKHSTQYQRLVEAFRETRPLEECVAIIE